MCRRWSSCLRSWTSTPTASSASPSSSTASSSTARPPPPAAPAPSPPPASSPRVRSCTGCQWGAGVQTPRSGVKRPPRCSMAPESSRRSTSSRRGESPARSGVKFDNNYDNTLMITLIQHFHFFILNQVFKKITAK